MPKLGWFLKVGSYFARSVNGTGVQGPAERQACRHLPVLRLEVCNSGSVYELLSNARSGRHSGPFATIVTYLVYFPRPLLGGSAVVPVLRCFGGGHTRASFGRSRHLFTLFLCAVYPRCQGVRALMKLPGGSCSKDAASLVLERLFKFCSAR